VTGQQGTGPPQWLAEGALSGVRVVEFGHFVAGPYCSLQLAYYGAEVIKIESTGRPDMWRLREGDTDINASVPFADHNKNKLSVTLDIKDERARETVIGLVKSCDIVVENFSFGVLDRLGLGYDGLVQHKPDLVMISLQGFGRSGSFRDAIALGPSLMAFSGMTSLWSEDPADPVGSQTSYPDYIVGIQAAFTLLCALEHRDRTGRGQYIEFAQVDAVLGLIAPQLAAASADAAGVTAGQAPTAADISGVYQCQGDDRWCVVEVRSPREWLGLVDAVPGLAASAGKHSAGKHSAGEDGAGEDGVLLVPAEKARAVLAEWMAARSHDEAMDALQARGVPAGAVHDARDLVADRHLRERNFGIPAGHPVLGDILLPGPPAHHVGGDGPVVTRHAPLLGEDRGDVLGRILGLTDEEIEQLSS
jgi:crotonobetainyl-CoA:carnitine CoA-transferase CaiB-like acyl-CoA transferase